MPENTPAEPIADRGDAITQSADAAPAHESTARDRTAERGNDAEPQDSEDVADSVTGNG